MMILLIIIAIITSQWDKEVQIRKMYDKYFFDVTEGKKKLANENEELQKEKLELAQQLSRTKNDIKVVEDTYKDRIYSLEAKLLKYQRENDKLASEIIEAHYQKQLKNGELEFREPVEVQNDEEQEQD